MPVTFDITSSLINKDTSVAFLNEPENDKARKDFNYLVSQSRLGSFSKLDHVVISSSTSQMVANVAVVAADAKKAAVEFPADIIEDQPDHYVGVVVYSEDNVLGVYLHPTNLIITKNGMFSNYKFNKKKNTYSIKINTAKWDEFKFGFVLQNHINM